MVICHMNLKGFTQACKCGSLLLLERLQKAGSLCCQGSCSIFARTTTAHCPRCACPLLACRCGVPMGGYSACCLSPVLWKRKPSNSNARPDLARAGAVDFCVTLGGDGTVLHMASLFTADAPLPPLVSFAMGTLGFLTPFDALGFEARAHFRGLPWKPGLNLGVRAMGRVWSPIHLKCAPAAAGFLRHGHARLPHPLRRARL